uniref:axin interactor, dorsalization-associated protein isoform X2 n=1 Tax=Myxine glutinosa TaxID=7769 RepID=UPI00358E510B
MAELARRAQHKWFASFRKATDFDSWGQLVEALDEYHILAMQLIKEAQSAAGTSDFTEEQKITLGKTAACLELRSKALQSTDNSEEPFTLEDLRKIEPVIKNVLTYDKEFPFDVQPLLQRKLLVPGEEQSLDDEDCELGMEDEMVAGGSPDTSVHLSSAHCSGSLLPRLPSEPGLTTLSLRIEKIGLKDAVQCIDPYITVSVKDPNGVDLTHVQDTPVASMQEDLFVHFGIEVEIQRPIEKLPKGTAIFFEFKHYKPKKRITSTKCFAFMEMDEIKSGSAVIELYKKPTDFKRRKLSLLTKKPLFLHIHQTLYKD